MSVIDYLDSELFGSVYNGDLPRLHSPNIDKICKELKYSVKFGSKIFIYGDYDMDGFCCMSVWKETFRIIGHTSLEFFQYHQRTHAIDPSILVQVDTCNPDCVIICDTGSSLQDREIIRALQMRGISVIVIDHHVFDGDYVDYANGNLIFNSYEERHLLNGDLISGAYSCLLVAKRLCEDYLNLPLSNNAKVFALASMYSDVVDLSTTAGRALYNVVASTKLQGSSLIQIMNEYGYALGRRFFSYQVSPRINSCFRSERFEPINRLMQTTDKYSMKAAYNQIKAVHDETTKLIKPLSESFQLLRCGNFLVAHVTSTKDLEMLKIRNYTGLIATYLAKEHMSAVVVVVKQANIYNGSYRDFFNRGYLSKFQLFCKANGHPPAFGLSFSDFDNFCQDLRILSTMDDVDTVPAYESLTSSLIESEDDIYALALYNEYMNTKPRVMIQHRCTNLRLIRNTKYKKIYDVGLPLQVTSSKTLIEGTTLVLEPCLCTAPELRSVDG